MQTLAFKNYRYPRRKENRFNLLVDGDAYFGAMFKAIESANNFILLEQYLISSGSITQQLIQRLCLAAERGVAVYMLLDDFGASGLTAKDRQQLTHANVRLCFFNPVHFKHFFNSLFRNHRKSLIVDGQITFVGGAGLTDEFSQQSYGPLAWHDVMLEIRGAVVSDWCDLFVKTWSKHSKQPVDIPAATNSSRTGTQSGRLLCSSPIRGQEINRSLIKHLRRVKHRAWITSPYFVTTRKIRRMLRQAAHRGVDVRLLLPGQYSDHPWISFATRKHYGRLLRNGVRIFEYQPRFIHAKVELCDGWVSIGSSNLDRWNQRWNLDANQAIYDQTFSQQIAEFFENDFALSREITWQAWQQRSWFSRFREAVSGQIVSWLEQLMRSRGH